MMYFKCVALFGKIKSIIKYLGKTSLLSCLEKECDCDCDLHGIKDLLEWIESANESEKLTQT